MFSYSKELHGHKKKQHKVKALDIIWKHFSGTWTPRNTLHVDDLPHNFCMNPKNGIPIVRYDCHAPSAGQDNELVFLSRYLVDVVDRLDDVTQMDHSTWTNIKHS